MYLGNDLIWEEKKIQERLHKDRQKRIRKRMFLKEEKGEEGKLRKDKDKLDGIWKKWEEIEKLIRKKKGKRRNEVEMRKKRRKLQVKRRIGTEF